MNKRYIFIGLAVSAVVIGMTAYVLLTPKQPAARPATPTLLPSVSHSVDPVVAPEADHDKGTVELSRDFPIVRRLPKETPYWAIRLDGEIKDGKVPLVAFINIRPGADEAKTLATQKPFVDKYVAESGQLPGTFTLRYESLKIDSY